MAKKSSPAKQAGSKNPKPEPVLLKIKAGLGGSSDDSRNLIFIHQIVNTLWVKNSSAAEQIDLVNGAVAALAGIGPTDEVEGQIAAQMIAAHNAAMECYRRAMLNEQSFEGRKENLTQANKLSRTHITLVEALNKHRGKGQQKVTVEHVHVHAGGQAIVGDVSTGGRAPIKSEEQPYGQIPHAPLAPMFRPDEKNIEAVPISRGERL